MQGYSTEGVPNYMGQTPDAKVTVPKESSTLPMFSPTQGNTDSGVACEGDCGGAGS